MNTAHVPLPSTYRSLASQVTHPGLYLDKFVGSLAPGKLSEAVQRPAVDEVVRLSNNPPMPRHEYKALFDRWKATVGAGGFPGTTAGPLTLHLARASALENAGICFHRVYGFVYLPGTGLKGLARAFAETVWLDAQDDKLTAWQQIEAVFGWAPGSNMSKPYLPDRAEEYRKNRPACSGSVIFHDAWPERWPELVTDILNNHHSKYYSEAQPPPPGDWEDPVPVYFLSVKPGTKFQFAIARRRSDTESELVKLAREWLIGGLTQLGAGAKTAGGYGDFVVEEPNVAPIPSAKRPSFTATLELVTPAFLAGARQQADDCDLRPSTLRGQLRWWWRTMHAGFVSVEDLREMEAAIWGDTKRGGTVRVTVRPEKRSGIDPVPGKSIQKDKKGREVLRADPAFLRSHGLIAPPNFKSTQGILYLSYGMDEMPAGRPADRKRRQCMFPGASWKIGFDTRPVPLRSAEGSTTHTARMVLEQAQAALWLLCQFGGVGSKSRHGFGSLQSALDGWTMGRVRETALQFRHAFQLAEQPNSSADTPALSLAVPAIELPAPWPDVWFALDQLGFSLQEFAQAIANKRQWRKEALGLPRKIGTSDDDGSRRTPPYRRVYDRQSQGEVVWLGQYHRHLGSRDADKLRHASPVHVHWEPAVGGGFRIRVIAFPTELLADQATSQTVLRELFEHLDRDLRERVERYPPPPTQPDPAPRRTGSASVAKLPTKRGSGTVVQVTILGKRAKGFEVQEAGRPPGTLSVGPPPAGADTDDGKTVMVCVHNDDPNKPQYKWPDPPKGGKR